MKKWLILSLIVFALETNAQAAKPNVLFIISDDQGYGDFGFMGNKVLRTPQLDKLAASAAVFRNYTTGVACSPGRAMLYSGRNYLSTGVWGVGARYGLRRDETLMPIFFRENGYSTFYLGKGDCVAPHRMSPHYAGWQESIYVGGYQHHNGRLYHTPLAPLYSTKPVDVEGWTSEFMTERGIQFIKEKKGSPWLLSMAYIIPHMPWKPVDERYAPYYRDKGCSENIAACFSHIEQMDTCVGQLVDALKETGQDENTIVVFVSDNGQTGMCSKKVKSVEGRIDHPDWAIRNVAGLRGGKSTAWENGTRVPLLVRMPGTIPAGMRTQFATAEDVLPTLLDVAGIPQDSVAHKPLSGVSLRPALMDKRGELPNREVFRITNWHPGLSLTGKAGYIPDPEAMKLEDYHAVLRGPQYKLEIYPGGKVELHDIISDKQERHDISKEHPEVARRMLVECRRQFRSLIDDGAFRFSTIYIGDPRSKNRRGAYFDSAARIQSHTGKITVIPKLTGFAREGDSVTYTIDSAKAGTYAISFTGEFADAAPLQVEVAGNVLHQQALSGNELTFGTVNLPKGKFPLRLVAGKPKGEARAATVDDIFFTARSPAASKPLGLRPGPNATILLSGKPYRGIGINYFSCFLRTLKDGNDTSYDAGFATLAEKGIPFARFCATGFWPRDMKLYVEDREEYFRRLDGVVNAAEKHSIGLVPSLFWYYACVPDLVDEPMDQWANPNSKTQAWMRNYVREVVTRYRDNPTIWAWELGNEFSLHADLPNAEHSRPKTHHSLGTPDSRSARDDLTYEMIGKAFTAFATAVRKHDPHRLIFTGDSFPRLSAWHQEQEGSWKHDSMEQFAEMLTKANPDPISGISLHAYEDDDQRFDEAMAVASKLKKPIFIGEFGAQHETPDQAAKCRRLLKAIIDHEIPLAALWVFDHAQQADFNVTADNGRAWQLDLIAEANRKLRTQAASKVH